jgi:hypothetical protein
MVLGTRQIKCVQADKLCASLRSQSALHAVECVLRWVARPDQARAAARVTSFQI